MIDFTSFEAFLVMGTTLFLAGQVLLIFWPKVALSMSFFMLLIAGTKFRGYRGSQTLVSGSVDSQIYFELTIYGLILAIALWNLVMHSHHFKRAYPFEVMILLYILLVIMSSLWSPVFSLTIVRGLQLLIIFTLIFVSLRVLGVPGTLKAIVICLLAYVLIFASMAVIFPWAAGSSRSVHGFNRFSWFGVNPITSANWIGMAGVLLIATYMNRKDFWSRRWIPIPDWCWLIPVMAFLIYVLFATHSRGALIAFVGTVAGLWVIKKFHLSFTMTIGGLAVVILAFIILGSGIGFEFSRLVPQSGTIFGDYVLRGHTEDSLLTLTGRTGLWMDMFEMIAHKPILGHGYLSTRVFLPGLRDWSAYAHNGFMQTLFDLGIVGIVILWYPVFKSVTGCLRCHYRAQPPWYAYYNIMLGALVYILLYSMLNESFSGIPSYDQAVTFMCVMAYERLYYYNQISVSTLVGSRRVVQVEC